MADREPAPAEAALERELVELGQALAFPPTPPLAPAVHVRLAQAGPPSRRPRFAVARRVALALAAALLLCALLLAAWPAARAALAGRLGVRGIGISQVPSVPSPRPAATAATTPAASVAPALGATVTALPAQALTATPPAQAATATPPAALTPAATPLPAGVLLGLGDRIEPGDIPCLASLPYLVPAALGPPDATYVSTAPQCELALLYRPGPDLPQAAETGVGLLFIEFRGATDEALTIGKAVGPGTRIERVTVGGQPGFWLVGRPHLFFYRAPGGEIRDETIRLAGNTLLWERGNLTLRIEGAIDKDGALKIAASVR